MRFRFTLRMMLVVIAIIAVGLGCVTNRLRLARHNQRAVAELWGMDLQRRKLGASFPAEQDFGQRGVAVVLSGPQYQDDVMPYLFRGLAAMTKLELESTGISDAGLARLSDLSRLRSLIDSDFTPVWASPIGRWEISPASAVER